MRDRAGPWQNVQFARAAEFAPLLSQQEPTLSLAGVPAATAYGFGKGRVVGGYQMVEHVTDAGLFIVAVPLAEKPARCCTAPDKAGLEWIWKDGILAAEFGGLAIHNVLIIE